MYTHLFHAHGAGRRVRAGIIGAGQYGTAIVTQSPAVPLLEVAAVCDLDVEAAWLAFRRAGFADDDCVVCATRGEALWAMGRARRVIVPDALLLMDLPLDVIVEASGVAEAGARHALAAIRAGKHVAMVSKETDVVVGPILKHEADRAGLVYTAVDGDQHGLLIGLVGWARELGLEVVCGGKALASDLIFDAEAGTLSVGRREVSLPEEEAASFRPFPSGEPAGWVQRRRVAAGDLGAPSAADVIEMAIAANATGLVPDVETLHGAALRIREIPAVMCPSTDGGILKRHGAIDAVCCLRSAHEAGLGGGVFVVAACENDYSRGILTSKGLIPNPRGTAALLYRPYHLCGVETPISLLCAGLLGIATGAREYLPRFDVVAQAAGELKAGEQLRSGDGRKLKALMRPAQAVSGSAPLPLSMVDGCRLAVDVPKGAVITTEMVERPDDSSLWSLRAEQDRQFLAAAETVGEGVR